MSERLYILYDIRAINDTDEAQVYVTCDSVKEAKSYKRTSFTDGVCYSYFKDYSKQPNELTDERFEFS